MAPDKAWKVSIYPIQNCQWDLGGPPQSHISPGSLKGLPLLAYLRRGTWEDLLSEPPGIANLQGFFWNPELIDEGMEQKISTAILWDLL